MTIWSNSLHPLRLTLYRDMDNDNRWTPKMNKPKLKEVSMLQNKIAMLKNKISKIENGNSTSAATNSSGQWFSSVKRVPLVNKRCGKKKHTRPSRLMRRSIYKLYDVARTPRIHQNLHHPISDEIANRTSRSKRRQAGVNKGLKKGTRRISNNWFLKSRSRNLNTWFPNNAPSDVVIWRNLKNQP